VLMHHILCALCGCRWHMIGYLLQLLAYTYAQLRLYPIGVQETGHAGGANMGISV
jgi:hypothetical protein